jgi:metallophosphoesterase superfamily enzyme
MPAAKAREYAIGDGVVALPQSLLWLERSRALVVADAHLAYEDVIGGALPLWSTASSLHMLLLVARLRAATEIVFLGDVIHGSVMSDGAADAVGNALALLRGEFVVTLIAGNHEGRSRGAKILGETHEAVERDGWMLVHGDRPSLVTRTIVGHLHPSLPLAAGTSMPVFVAAPTLIVVPALTPYSSGLNVLSRACATALRAFGVASDDVSVVASGEDRVFPFGALGPLRALLSGRM